MNRNCLWFIWKVDEKWQMFLVWFQDSRNVPRQTFTKLVQVIFIGCTRWPPNKISGNFAKLTICSGPILFKYYKHKGKKKLFILSILSFCNNVLYSIINTIICLPKSFVVKVICCRLVFVGEFSNSNCECDKVSSFCQGQC